MEIAMENVKLHHTELHSGAVPPSLEGRPMLHTEINTDTCTFCYVFDLI